MSTNQKCQFCDDPASIYNDESLCDECHEILGSEPRFSLVFVLFIVLLLSIIIKLVLNYWS